MGKYRRYVLGATVLFGFGLAGALASLPALGASRIQTGAAVAPVPLNMTGLNPALVRRDRTVPLEQVGGFLVLWSEQAGELCRRLKAAGVWADFRGDALRLGPAPYLCDAQLIDAMDRLGQVCRELTRCG